MPKYNHILAVMVHLPIMGWSQSIVVPIWLSGFFLHIPCVNASIFGSFGSNFLFLFRIFYPVFVNYSAIS